MTELDKKIIHDWLTVLVGEVAAKDVPTDDSGTLKRCASAHYKAIHMEESIKDLKGNLSGFFDFLQSKMNWIVEHDQNTRTIIANENKPDCVCPLYREGLLENPALCECSRGFAEEMFKYIIGKKVEASIVESVLRKGTRCIYKINY